MKKFKRKVMGYVAAGPGTKLVLFGLEPDCENATFRTEHRVVAWQVCKDTDKAHFTVPIILGFAEEEYLLHNFYAVIFGDGGIHYESDGYGDFDSNQFSSIDQFATHVEEYHKNLVIRMTCLDCKECLIGHLPSVDKSPMLKDDIWKSIMPSRHGVLCRPCMEHRLGRVLTEEDFSPDWLKYINHTST